MRSFQFWLFGLGTGVFLATLLVHIRGASLPRAFLMEKHQGAQEFINPLLECQTPEHSQTKGAFLFDGLEKRLKDFISTQTHDGSVQRVDIYFRDLNHGHWIGINGDQGFAAGSLLKVPLSIGYLKEAERDPGLLKKRVLFNDAELIKLYALQSVPPSSKLEVGKRYTVDNLLERLSLYSDNVAAALLEHYDQRTSFKRTAVEMDIPIRYGHPPHRPLTVMQYAGFFRMLYNASYLNRENSNRILGWLARADFKNGLNQGVPASTRVAHKFGEAVDAKGTVDYFHDCGVVYYLPRPYLLCVVTKGTQIARSMKVIQEISRLTYDEVKSLDENGSGNRS